MLRISKKFLFKCIPFKTFSNVLVAFLGSGTGNNQTPTRVRLFSMELEASKIGQVN